MTEQAEPKTLEVVLLTCKSYTDGRRKFKRGTPVLLPYSIAKKYKGNLD